MDPENVARPSNKSVLGLEDEESCSSDILYEPLPRPSKKAGNYGFVRAQDKKRAFVFFEMCPKLKKYKEVCWSCGQDQNSFDFLLDQFIATSNKPVERTARRSRKRKSERVDGALQCLPLRDADELRSVPCLDAAKELARCMHEPKYNLLNNTIKQIGIERTIELFYETCQIQEQGGIKSLEGKVKKAPGGVFFAQLKKCATQDQLRTIFHHEKAKKRKRLQAQKEKKKKLVETSLKCVVSEPCELHVRRGLQLEYGETEFEKRDEDRGISTDGDKEEGEVEETEEMGVKSEENVIGESEMMDVDYQQQLLADLDEKKSALEAAQAFERTDSLHYGGLLSLD